MVKYKVVFEFRNELEEWVEADLCDNGAGFSEEDALDLARQLKYQGHRNVRIEEMDGCGYAYGMKYRGFSLGCQPMSGLLERKDDESGRYYDILIYDRELSDRELEDFELDPLVLCKNTEQTYECTTCSSFGCCGIIVGKSTECWRSTADIKRAEQDAEWWQKFVSKGQ